MINGYKDDLITTSWLGEVVDVADPEKTSRVKVRVFGKFDELEVEDIPRAFPGNNMTAGSGSGGGFHSPPKLGSIVAIKFDNGNLYHPEYYYNQKLSDEAKQEISNSYENSHIIIYDSVTDGSLKIFFTEEKGLMLDYKSTKINIKPDKSINLETASGNSKLVLLDNGNMTIDQAEDITVNCRKAKISATNSIHLDCNAASSIKLGSNVTDAILLGTKFQTYFNTHTHTGNLGIPTSPPIVLSTPDHLSTIVKTQ